jgi:hypothetical protein
MTILAPPAEAYPTYSADKVINPDGAEEAVGNCKTCHGHFRATDETNGTPFLQDEYISPADDKPWREMYQEVEADPPVPEEEVGLHDIHRHIMLDKIGRSRCSVCHTRPPFYPVFLGSSTGGEGLEAISCGGCHGRNEDAGNDSISRGLGAGLRQHHTNAGVTECKTCHRDANPANYTPVGEDVSPSYYAAPNDVFVNKPTDPCNQRRDEDYAGGPKGLDNDGDGRYDMSDRDCKGSKP